mmetsp:Transcript_7214/g.17354  ORF Transcript_7214/g.17354 Transcript_7214/m.17354 type:complete len:106 (+) Transcript_7214:36-353(+)
MLGSAARQAMRRVATRTPATVRSMAGGNGLATKTPPYKYMRGIVEQHTSPFEVRQIDTLVANFGRKFKHETVDNIPDLLPAILLLAFTIGYTKVCNEANQAEERF